MISSSSSWVPRKGAVATDDPATAPFFVHSFEGNARDRDIGKAEPDRTTRSHGTDQEIEPEIDPGAIGARYWNKLVLRPSIRCRLPILLCRMSASLALPNISSLAELLPHQKASDPIPHPAVAALKDIQSSQQQHVASLQENTALLQQDSIALASLRQSVVDQHVDVKKISAQITDEHQDVKKISAQISTLIAKVNSLKNAMTPEVTSSIPARHAGNRPSRAVRKKMARQPKPVGPVSLGGAPLSLPATTPTPQG